MPDEYDGEVSVPRARSALQPYTLDGREPPLRCHPDGIDDDVRRASSPALFANRARGVPLRRHPRPCSSGRPQATRRSSRNTDIPGSTTCSRRLPPARRAAESSATRQSREPPCGLHPPVCLSGRPHATPAIVAEHRHPGIDDLQSSSSAGPRGGGVECNSTIPGTALTGLPPVGLHPARATSDPGDRRGTPTSRDRRLAVVVFRRSDGRRGRVQLDNPGSRPAGSVTPRLCLSGRPQAIPATVAEHRQPPGSTTCSRRLPRRRRGWRARRRVRARRPTPARWFARRTG
jgi:hypothetical protein